MDPERKNEISFVFGGVSAFFSQQLNPKKASNFFNDGQTYQNQKNKSM